MVDLHISWVLLLTGKQAEVLNILLEDLLEGHSVSETKLKEVLGHTPIQVGSGCDGVLQICLAIVRFALGSDMLLQERQQCSVSNMQALYAGLRGGAVGSNSRLVFSYTSSCCHCLKVHSKILQAVTRLLTDGTQSPIVLIYRKSQSYSVKGNSSVSLLTWKHNIAARRSCLHSF